MTLTVRGSDVRVSVLTADPGGATALQSRQDDVRAALAGAGLDLSGWDVGGGTQSRQQERRPAADSRRAALASDAAADVAAGSPVQVSRGLFL